MYVSWVYNKNIQVCVPACARVLVSVYASQGVCVWFYPKLNLIFSQALTITSRIDVFSMYANKHFAKNPFSDFALK